MLGGSLCDGSGGVAGKGPSQISALHVLVGGSVFHIHTYQEWGVRRVGSSWGSPPQVLPAWLLCLSRAPVEEVVAAASGAAGGDDGGASARPLTKAQPGHRSYNLQERRRIGSMTGAEQALLPRVPTDESEAQTLATADLDLMKSECWLG